MSQQEVQIKIIMRYYFIPTEQPLLKRLTIPSVGEDVAEVELLSIAGGIIKGTTTLENSLMVSYKLYMYIYAMIQEFHSYILKNNENTFLKKTERIISTLFTVAKH